MDQSRAADETPKSDTFSTTVSISM